MKEIQIGSYTVSSKRMFIIAEAGVNHDGDFNQAVELIRAAKRAGADAIKFQAFTAEALCDVMLTEDKDVEHLTGGTKSSFDMYKALEFSEEQLAQLKNYADEEGILFCASVFDIQRAQFLHELGVEMFKVSSGDLTYYPLLKYVASLGKPIILSTGMATLVEVKNAVAILEETGCEDIVVLHCTSDYPPNDNEINLNAITSMENTLGHPVGYSDHTEGLAIPFALAGMKAQMLEKHFTLDSSLPGPDHKLSLDVDNFSAMVKGIRKIEHAMGSYEKHPTHREESIVLTTRRGIKAARSIEEGAVIREQDLRVVKPMTGLCPEFYDLLPGKKVTRAIAVNEPITKEDIIWQ